MMAPLPADLPPLAMAPPAAPSPAPSAVPMRPGLAMRQARSPPVEQSSAALATFVTRAGTLAAGWYAGREAAGRSAVMKRASVRGEAATLASSAWAGAVGRSIQAVVRPEAMAVTTVRAIPIVASFHGLFMVMSSLSFGVTRRFRRVFGPATVVKALRAL